MLSPLTPNPPLPRINRPLRALVRGAGPAGSLAALALADAGWAVRLIDRSPPSRLLAIRRAYAFTHSSRELLRRLGLWDRVGTICQPFERLELVDLGCRRGFGFGPSDLWGARPEGQAVGWIAEHGPLMAMLLDAVESDPAIHSQLGAPLETPPRDGLSTDADADADLIVAADGSLSSTREALGIGVWRHAYGQHCLTAQVSLRGAASDTAWERLRPEGPFALLPMPRGRFQVVWSAPSWRCRQLESLSPAAFLDALAPVLPAGVEIAALEEPPRAYPVQLHVARRLHRGRTILLGETAHRCHPVGGQGLNLSWRDVAVLHRLAQRARSGRLPLDRLAESYARRRWPDLCLTLLITDSLVRIFSNRHPLLLSVRKPTLLVLARAPWLRRCLLGVMTHGPCQPFQTAAT
ncbi:MAG: FAD-dependent monooxygenase [Cyanobacteriota bacterium]|nr:FAD-dependent monooxygenase [Cyanobacteriota bacterium]